jgi:glycerol-3-phosphate dehydrogenase subunit B
MTYDVVVIGAGLAGLTAALRLAEEGRRVLIVAKGVGATHLSPPTIDVLGYVDGPVESPARALEDLAASHPQHPYGRLRVELIADSIEWFKARVADQGYRGGLEDNFLLPTAVGVAKPAAVVPETMAAGDLRAAGRYVFVGLKGLKDFYPSYLADNLRRARTPSGEPVSARGVELAPPLGGEGDVSSTGFARRFEQPEFRAAVVRELQPHLVAGELVGFPAVLGLEHAQEVWHDLEHRLGHRVFEVPTLPPSVPGIRLFETMKAALRRAGGRLVLGSEVVGAVHANGRVEGVAALTAARAVTYHAPSFVLASGGFAAGGLHSDSFGKIRETVFDLPLGYAPEPGRPRFAPGYFDEHPISRTGVAVDDKLRPVAPDSAPVYENLRVAGATLGGAVPWREASGNGLSLATGYAAAAAILERGS